MTSVLLNTWKGEIEKLLLEACYSGERFILRRKDGTEVALVPMEDLQVLESHSLGDRVIIKRKNGIEVALVPMEDLAVLNEIEEDLI